MSCNFASPPTLHATVSWSPARRPCILFGDCRSWVADGYSPCSRLRAVREQMPKQILATKPMWPCWTTACQAAPAATRKLEPRAATAPFPPLTCPAGGGQPSVGGPSSPCLSRHHPLANFRFDPNGLICWRFDVGLMIRRFMEIHRLHRREAAGAHGFPLRGQLRFPGLWNPGWARAGFGAGVPLRRRGVPQSVLA